LKYLSQYNGLLFLSHPVSELLTVNTVSHIQHTAVLIMFAPNLQIITITRMLSSTGNGSRLMPNTCMPFLVPNNLLPAAQLMASLQAALDGTRWVGIDGYTSACCVTSTFDLLTPKCNQNIHKPNYICDQSCMKFSSLVFEIWCSHGFGMHRHKHSLTDGQTSLQ